jgi:hypothetical protein
MQSAAVAAKCWCPETTVESTREALRPPENIDIQMI